MELTHTYKNKGTLTGLRTSVKEILLTFINKHAQVFEALSRSGTPYGGNWLPENYQSANTKRTGLNPEEQITDIQQQIGSLSQAVTALKSQINTQQSQPEVTEEIGINRFRALKADI